MGYRVCGESEGVSISCIAGRADFLSVSFCLTFFGWLSVGSDTPFELCLWVWIGIKRVIELFGSRLLTIY